MGRCLRSGGCLVVLPGRLPAHHNRSSVATCACAGLGHAHGCPFLPLEVGIGFDDFLGKMFCHGVGANARVKAQNSVPASETALREQNQELRRKLNDMRAERDEYKKASDALARALNVLTTENEELRRRANRPREFTGPRPLAQLGLVPAAGGTRVRLA